MFASDGGAFSAARCDRCCSDCWAALIGCDYDWIALHFVFVMVDEVMGGQAGYRTQRVVPSSSHNTIAAASGTAAASKFSNPKWFLLIQLIQTRV